METIYNAPSKFRIEPYGTCLKQLLNSLSDSEDGIEKFLIWIQASKDPGVMLWITTEKFFSTAFDVKLHDIQFKEMALKAFEENKSSL